MRGKGKEIKELLYMRKDILYWERRATATEMSLQLCRCSWLH